MAIRRYEGSGSGEFQEGDSGESRTDGSTENQSNGLTLPWTADTRQVQGRKSEKKILKKLGIRQHPNSGAGKIKFDGSNEDAIVEVKDANKSFTMNAAYLNSIYTTAIKQSKDAVLLIQFPDLTIECLIKRRTP